MKKLISIFLVLCIIGLALVGCSSPTSTESHPKVVYEVTGTASAVSITYINPQGGTEQYAEAGLPSRITYLGFPYYFLSIIAQNQGASGNVTVTIYVNDKVYKRSTSQGAYVIASASGANPGGGF